MTGVPPALAAALQELPQRQAFESTSVRSLKVQRGDLRFAASVPGSDATARLVLVISSASDLEFAEVLLAHTAAEMAGDVDAVLSPSLSGAPYPVVIQTDLRGAVWTLQLGPAVGHLEESTIRALSASDAPVAGTSDGLSRGSRLAGPVDPRWSFKTDEGAEFRSLTADCTGALLDEGAWQVEPGLLRPDLLDLADDPSALVAELVHWVATRRLDLDTADIETLLALGALDLEAWAAFGDVGLDIWTTIQTVVERAATAPREHRQAPLRIVTAAHLRIQAWSAEPDAIYYLGQKELAPA